MTFKPRIWYPIAIVLSVVNLVAAGANPSLGLKGSKPANSSLGWKGSKPR